MYESEGGLTDNVLILTVRNMTTPMSEGSHTLTIVLYDGKTLTADFTV